MADQDLQVAVELVRSIAKSTSELARDFHQAVLLRRRVDPVALARLDLLERQSRIITRQAHVVLDWALKSASLAANTANTADSSWTPEEREARLASLVERRLRAMSADQRAKLVDKLDQETS